MKLILEYAPNPDLMNGQGNGSGFWGSPVDFPKQAPEVKSLKDAQKKFVAWRERNQLGGGNMARHTGEVYDDKKKCIARISYNGRVWTPGEWPNCKEIKI
jgi:hypothetical protein